jgi:flavin reductase (DIM6/NTAB) family NADH-FMN oxidoreductase RutF
MRKLWNRGDDAVWSLCTQSETGVPNMNICTYVTAVSLEPKLMMIAVYKNTQTLKNVAVGKTVLLQLLGEDFAPVVRICGQLSGKNIDKISRLKKRYELKEQAGLFYFKDAAGFMELQVEQLIKTSGDHDLLVGKVTKSKNLHNKTILTTTYLKENGYIR